MFDSVGVSAGSQNSQVTRLMSVGLRNPPKKRNWKHISWLWETKQLTLQTRCFLTAAIVNNKLWFINVIYKGYSYIH